MLHLIFYIPYITRRMGCITFVIMNLHLFYKLSSVCFHIHLNKNIKILRLGSWNYRYNNFCNWYRSLFRKTGGRMCPQSCWLTRSRSLSLSRKVTMGWTMRMTPTPGLSLELSSIPWQSSRPSVSKIFTACLLCAVSFGNSTLNQMHWIRMQFVSIYIIWSQLFLLFLLSSFYSLLICLFIFHIRFITFIAVLFEILPFFVINISQLWCTLSFVVYI